MRYLMVLLTLVLAGCAPGSIKAAKAEGKTQPRFKVTEDHYDQFGRTIQSIAIVYDTQTDESYMVVSNCRGIVIVRINNTKVEK